MRERGGTASPLPAEGAVVSTGGSQRLLGLAYDASDLARVRDHLRGLTWAGHHVEIAWLVGDLGDDLDFLPGRRIQPGGDGGLLSATLLDPAVLELVDRSDGVMAFGDPAKAVVEEVVAGRSVRVPHQDLRGWPGVARVWTDLRDLIVDGGLTPQAVVELADRVALVRAPTPEEAQDQLLDLLSELIRTGHHERALRLLEQIREGADPERRRALAAHARTSSGGREDPDLRGSVRGLLPVIDRAVESADLSRATSLTTTALGLLFHVELHAAGPSSPLVDSPEDFLREWRGSLVGQVLARPAPRPERADAVVTGAAPTGTDPGGDQHRVVVLRGSYPRFSTQVVDDLEARPDTEVEVHEWSGVRTITTGLGIRPEPVAARLRQALGGAVPGGVTPGLGDIEDERLTEALGRADAVFVDWADRGAVVALLHVPDGVRVTLRIHSMDALSPWVHLIDWSRVDDLVLVSGHLRDVVQRLLGERLSTTRVHVVPNVVDASRIPGSKAAGHRRRLVIIGWAQTVKDPIWALEVLAGLRRHDPDWRLVLVGPDFLPTSVTSAARYAEDFRARLTEPDVLGGVEFVGETSDIAPHLASAGFVLSSSRRESFGVGLVEAAASGAVPVVRSWPMFAALDGARRLFPAEWVVDDVDEAVERVLAHADAPEWERASASARAEVAERFLAGAPARTLGRIIVGEMP